MGTLKRLLNIGNILAGNKSTKNTPLGKEETKFRQKQKGGKYIHGGFRSHAASSDAVIFFPKRQYKGYVKDAKMNSTFNKNK